MPLKKKKLYNKPIASELSTATLMVDLAKSASPKAAANASAAKANTVKPPEFAKPQFTYHQLQSLFKKPIERLSLHPLFPSSEFPSLKFTLQPLELISTISLVVATARQLVTNENHPLFGISKHLLTFLDSRMKLYKWGVVANFVDKNKPQAKEGLAIREYQDRAEQLIERLYLRIKWLFDLCKNSRQLFKTEECLWVIVIDCGWVGDASIFMRDSQKGINILNQKYQELLVPQAIINKPQSSTLSTSSAAPNLAIQATNNAVALRTGSPCHAPPPKDLKDSKEGVSLSAQLDP